MRSKIESPQKLLYDNKYKHGLLHHRLDIKDKLKKTLSIKEHTKNPILSRELLATILQLVAQLRMCT